MDETRTMRIQGRLTVGDVGGPLGLQISVGDRLLTATPIKSKEASEAADLASAVSDLEFAQRLARLEPADEDLEAALLESIVMAYGRSFSTGRSALVKAPRRRLGEYVDQLDPEDREAHDQVMHMRDQHIAHRVDRELKQTIFAELRDPDGVFFGVMPLIVTQVGKPLTIAQVSRLTEQLLPTLREVLDAELGEIHRSIAEKEEPHPDHG